MRFSYNIEKSLKLAIDLNLQDEIKTQKENLTFINQKIFI